MSEEIVFETFREIERYQREKLTLENPSCVNGHVQVKKYRITVELIEEPDEVIHARIQKMWDECKNHHHRGPLRSMAEKYGLELNYE